MPAQSGIYLIKNRINHKVYVGSSRDISHRLSRHKTDLSKSRHQNEKLQRAWDKYGRDAFEFVVHEVVEPSALTIREQFWIEHLRAVKDGYNICPNAYTCAGRKLSETHVAKIIAARAGYRHSDETRAKISLAHRGAKRSSEHSRNISLANLGRPHSQEHNRKVSAALKGRPLSEATRIAHARYNRIKSFQRQSVIVCARIT